MNPLTFAFDADNDTPEMVAERRRRLQLLAHGMGGARNIGDGVGDMLKGLAAGIGNYQANRAEAAGQSGANREFSLLDLFGGQGARTGFQSPAPASAEPANGGGSGGSDLVPGLEAAINKAAARYGVSAAYLRRNAQIESSGGRNLVAPTSTARGPFMFTKATARAYNLRDPMNFEQSADAAARLARDNGAALAKALGRAPTDGELYLAHQQGQGGAVSLLRNPNDLAMSMLGEDAIRNNGGAPGMTGGQFANKWIRKFEGAGGQPARMLAGGDAPFVGGAGTDMLVAPYGPASDVARQHLMPPGDPGRVPSLPPMQPVPPSATLQPVTPQPEPEPVITPAGGPAPQQAQQPQQAMAPMRRPMTNPLYRSQVLNREHYDPRVEAMRAQAAMGGSAPSAPSASPAASVTSVTPVTAAPQAAPQAATAQPAGMMSPDMQTASTAASPAQQGGMGGGPSIPRLVKFLSNGWATPQQRDLATMMLKQKLAEMDPKGQLEAEKLQLEVEDMRNPRMKPADAARIEMDRKKQEFEQSKPIVLGDGSRVYDPKTKTITIDALPPKPSMEITDIGGNRVAIDKNALKSGQVLGASPSRGQPAPSGYRPTEDGKGIERIPGYRDTQLEMEMRKEFDGQTKDYRTIRDSYNRVQTSDRNPTPAGDMALIYNYMKMLDPGSVVRETEFAMAAKAGSFGEQIQSAVSRVLTGKMLADDIRRDFVNKAREIYSEQNATFQSLSENYRGVAERNGLDPANVIGITPRENQKRTRYNPQTGELE